MKYLLDQTTRDWCLKHLGVKVTSSDQLPVTSDVAPYSHALPPKSAAALDKLLDEYFPLTRKKEQK